jgi:hypothetical protein
MVLARRERKEQFIQYTGQFIGFPVTVYQSADVAQLNTVLIIASKQSE